MRAVAMMKCGSSGAQAPEAGEEGFGGGQQMSGSYYYDAHREDRGAGADHRGLYPPSPRFTESSLRNDHQDEDLDSNAKRVGPGKSRVLERIEQQPADARVRGETCSTAQASGVHMSRCA